eukprot:scaffold3171_cov380-Prasinococcus_capsulatus_cf.AAC.3
MPMVPQRPSALHVPCPTAHLAEDTPTLYSSPCGIQRARLWLHTARRMAHGGPPEEMSPAPHCSIPLHSLRANS